MGKTTKRKPKPAVPDLEPPKSRPKHMDKRRRRVEWSMEIPTDGKGNVSLNTVSALAAHLDAACNAISQWARMDSNPSAVERLVIRERGKKPKLVARFTLNRGLAGKVVSKGRPNFRLI